MDDLSPPFRLSSRLISFHLVPSCFNHVAIMFPAWSIMFPSISHHVSTMSPSFPMCPQLGVAHLSAMFSSCQLRVAHLDYGVSSVFIYPSMFPSCLLVGQGHGTCSIREREDQRGRRSILQVLALPGKNGGSGQHRGWTLGGWPGHNSRGWHGVEHHNTLASTTAV